MKIKESLKNFFKPTAAKIMILFALEFILTFSLLLLGDRMSSWQVYLISPNIMYLENTINPLFITPEQLSFHGAVANIIALFYLYFLSCSIIRIISRVRKIGRNK